MASDNLARAGKAFFVYLQDAQRGPLGESELRDLFAQGKIASNTPCWHEGLADWSTLDKCIALPSPQTPARPKPPGLQPTVAHAADNNWYYEIDGKRYGPVGRVRVTELVKTGSLHANSLVWKVGMKDWQAIRYSEFSTESTVPPPLTGDAVKNGLAWALAFAPVTGAFLQAIVGGAAGVPAHNLWLITLVLNISLCIADEKSLKHSGHAAPNAGWAFLVPVYLYQRASKLKQSQAYFFAWWACFFLSFFL
ncbi:MAG: DUF4339 domain-containing protein [Bdellovibrionales bacterium]|nr:DUF4339 domain-containing protein [Bdellovibrionales bacterium]